MLRLILVLALYSVCKYDEDESRYFTTCAMVGGSMNGT